MVNLIAMAVIVAIVGAAAGYLYKAKKRGVRCVGCPDSGHCSRSCGSCSGCCQK